uniref:DENN domain containing 1A n=1 Tax=Mus musculus TaxID=10090 RepID=D6RHL0_MOUSE
MGSRIKQNPETTFEVYVEVAYPRTGGTLSGSSTDFDQVLFSLLCGQPHS